MASKSLAIENWTCILEFYALFPKAEDADCKYGRGRAFGF